MMIPTSMCFVQSSKVGDDHQQVSDHYYSDDMENDYTEDDDNDNWCTPFISGWHINAMMMTITIITLKLHLTLTFMFELVHAFHHCLTHNPW